MKLIYMIFVTILWVFLKWPIVLFIQILTIIFGYLWRFKAEDIIIFHKTDWGIAPFSGNPDWVLTLNGARRPDTYKYYRNPLDYLMGKITEVPSEEVDWY